MQMKIFSVIVKGLASKRSLKAGVSLIAVLLFMLMATIAATATWKWITSEGFSSQSRMIKREALQSAEAGIQATRAWMTYHANDVGALIREYQSTENIVREVMCYYAEEPEIHTGVVNGTKSRLIGVYSPIKRSLKTSFALCLGQILSNTQRVLYIDIEDYHGFNVIFHQNYMADISDLLFYIQQSKKNFPCKLASVVQRLGALDYVPPAISPEDIKQVNGEAWMLFLNEVLSCNYDYVILDIGEGIKNMKEILRSCETIYTPIREDMISKALDVRRSAGLVDSSATNCFRLVHGEGDGLPGLIIDWYDGVCVLQAHSAGMFLARNDIARALQAVYGDPLRAVYDKSEGTAPFKADLPLGDGYLYRADGIPDLCPRTVLENGHRFRVDWENGQKTGFFLDQKYNRRPRGAPARKCRCRQPCRGAR